MASKMLPDQIPVMLWDRHRGYGFGEQTCIPPLPSHGDLGRWLRHGSETRDGSGKRQQLR